MAQTPSEQSKPTATTGTDSHPSGSRSAVIKEHSRAVRWMHWINFPLIMIMIWSGLRIYWADRQGSYSVGIGNADVSLFGDWFFSFLNAEGKLAAGLAYHFSFGWLLIANGLVFLIYTALSGHWREIIPDKTAFAKLGSFLAHELKLTKKAPGITSKYNPAQQFAYATVLLLATIEIVTGFGLYKPTQLSGIVSAFGGYENTRKVHFAITIVLVGFFFVHLAQVGRAGWENLRAMLTGHRKATPEDEAKDGVSPSPLSTAELERVTRRNMILGAGASVGAIGGLARFKDTDRPGDTIPALTRFAHRTNEAIWRRSSQTDKLAPEFSPTVASPIRVNGSRGIRGTIDFDTWSLQVVGPDGTTLGVETIATLRSLPKKELTVEHKCVEGWSHVVTWGGLRFSELIEKYEITQSDLPNYVNLSTPPNSREGDEFYVSIDIESAMHPQTLLAYEMMGEPLDSAHGAPLRLTTTLKYGLKMIKRIGKIELSDTRGPDFWTERGYDWYSHL